MSGIPLPEFALAVYRREGVSAACLRLQERFDVDVNIVLCAAYMAAIRNHLPTAADVATLHGAVDEWHRNVVRPLRAVRRVLKTGPPPAPTEATAQLRAKIQRDEIEAELIELAALGAAVDELAPETATREGDFTIRAIECVLPELNDDDRRAVAVIAAAARAESA